MFCFCFASPHPSLLPPPLSFQMDMMHGMLARYSRGETASVSILARAHDLRYEAQVSHFSAMDQLRPMEI